MVYFTDDPDYQPAMEGDWYYYSTCMGPLPPGMSLRNCWGWRFNGGVFQDAREPAKPSAQQALIDTNRAALQRILRDKIDAIRAPWLAACLHGDALRALKLAEAQTWLAGRDPDEQSSYPLLEAVALARGVSLQGGAELIVAKADAMHAMLLESERFREQMSEAIRQARSEAQLQALREWLLDKIYPELTREFKFKRENTEPPRLDAPLSEKHRRHEIARLRVQLREAINRQRAPLQSAYVHNDELRRHKARLAQALLNNLGVRPEGIDLAPLEAYAEGRGLTLTAAAELIVHSMAVSAELLAKTEAVKDRMLARIDAIENSRDIAVLDDALAAL